MHDHWYTSKLCGPVLISFYVGLSSLGLKYIEIRKLEANIEILLRTTLALELKVST